MALTADGRRTVSGSADSTLKVWEVETGEEVRTLTGHTAGVWGVALTLDGRRAVSASDDRTVVVWSLSTGDREAVFTTDGPVLSCAVSADGYTVVAGDVFGGVHFLRLEGLE